MIKLRYKQSKAFTKELNNLSKQCLDNTLYNLSDKQLNFIGAQYLLNRAIKISHPLKAVYTESQPTLYDKENECYWTYSGIITLYLSYEPNRKTKYNLNTISNALNIGYGYILKIKTPTKTYTLLNEKFSKFLARISKKS